MRAKDIIPASKPRNFVAKNQKTAGAGAHKDKKRAEKQGDVKHKKDLMPTENITTEGPLWKSDAYTRDQQAATSGFGRKERDWDEGDTEPPNNFAIYINGKKWKVFKGRGYYADDFKEREHYRQLQDWAQKKSDATGKKWTVHITGEAPTA